jgi:hypothetical protein
MGNRKRLKIITGAILAMVFLNFSGEAFAQISDSAKVPFRFAGGVSVTNKGISTVPNLTLGKPAAIFDISAGRGKLSF